MKICDALSILIVATGLALIGGCHEYQVEIDLQDDGTGTRTTTFETELDLSPVDQRLLAVGGDGWERTTFVDHEGKETWRYWRRQSVDGLDAWPATGGTLQRGTEDGEICLVSDVKVEEVRGAGRRRLVYRETLSWTGLTEEVAAVVARDYAAFLRDEFPDLPDSLVHEARGAMAATVIQNWAELTGSEPGPGPATGTGTRTGNELEYSGAADNDDPEAELGARFSKAFGLRLERAGVDPELARAVVRATAGWESLDGVEKDIPGLDHAFRSSFLLTVTMPAHVTGGNADTVEGNVARFRVELSNTLPGPVTLEAICER